MFAVNRRGKVTGSKQITFVTINVIADFSTHNMRKLVFSSVYLSSLSDNTFCTLGILEIPPTNSISLISFYKLLRGKMTKSEPRIKKLIEVNSMLMCPMSQISCQRSLQIDFW
jgi:hypothetical protein